MPHLHIIAVGGTSFDCYLDEEYLGRTEFGDIDEDGQYEQDEDEIVDHVREAFEIPEDTTASVK